MQAGGLGVLGSFGVQGVGGFEGFIIKVWGNGVLGCVRVL